MPQGHFTADEWMRYVGENMPDAQPPALEGFRNDNNIFVDGLPPPQYSGPLSSGGSAGARPQATGVSTVDPEDETDMPPAGALPYKSVGDWAQGMQGLSGEQAAYGRQRESERAAQYEAARKALEERRFGPSEAERWYALSAAIGTPMVRPSFGGVMRNVSSAMGDFSKARREAEVSRADALAALQQSYLSGNDAAKIAEFRARREAMAPVGSVLAAQARAQPFKSVIIENGIGYDPITSEKLTQPGPNGWAALSANPTDENLANFVRTFGPRFADKARAIVAYARGGK